VAPPRLELARLPTPLERHDRLSEAWGGPTIWVKRDDLAGFGLSGNKVRKLEFHLAAALEAGATTVVTCGGVQSNHCRATALAAARLGLRAVLYLRTERGVAPAEPDGNYLLGLLAGAECRFVTPGEYVERDVLLTDAAAEIGDAWMIPEGASDHLGMLGFVRAMEELGEQLRAEQRSVDVIWHAASSGGTTAGMIRGAAAMDRDTPIVGSSIDHSAPRLAGIVEAILDDADAEFGAGPRSTSWQIVDDYVGGGYGVASTAELDVQLEATRLTGLIFDPTYTGKALFGLHTEIEKGRFGPGQNVVFWHTGGGFAVQSATWRDRLPR
jgi:D-cysteine desulfhydrase